MRRLCILITAAMAAVAAGASPARAHLEDMPNELRMTIHVQRHGAVVEALIRTPLVLLSNVGLPLYGEHSVDAVAFYEDDPHVAGEASYAERASRAVLHAIRITANSAPLSFEVQRVVLAPEGRNVLATADSEPSSSVKGDPQGAIHHHRGYLDILAHAQDPRQATSLALTPMLGPALAERVVLEVKEAIGDKGIQTHVLHPASGTLRLD